MSEWQAIETAPKDMSDVLVWANRYIIAHQNKFGDWTEAWAHAVDGDAIYMDSASKAGITHWMPLPAPPTNLTGGK